MFHHAMNGDEYSSHRRPQTKNSLVFLYGLSFLYTIVIGIAGGMLLQKLIAADDPPDGPHAPIEPQREMLGLHGVSADGRVSASLTPLYDDEDYAATIMAHALEDMGVGTTGTALALRVTNNGETALEIPNSGNLVSLTLSDGTVVSNIAWPVHNGNLRARQFTQGGVMPSHTQAIVWLRFEQAIPMARIERALVTLASLELPLTRDTKADRKETENR